MNYKRIDNKIILRLEIGEDIIESLKEIGRLEKISLGSFSGLGAANDVTLGIYKISNKEYTRASFKEDMEILSLSGNYSTMNDEVYVHCHISLSREDFSLVGGHLEKAIVSVTSEIIIDIIDGQVDRYYDEEIGVNLLKL